jgi:hypothetical protein
MEHFDLTKGDLKKTAMITLAHLKEFPDYNTRLKAMEREGDREWAKKKNRNLNKSRTFEPSEPKMEYKAKVEKYLEGFEPMNEIEGKEEYED